MSDFEGRVRFQIRVPPDLNDWLDKQAVLNNRSKNGQILEIFKHAREVEQKHSYKKAQGAGNTSGSII